MTTYSDGHVQTIDEKHRDMMQVDRIYSQLAREERRARPRCTHRPEDIMRMTDTVCPACTPDAYAAQLASAPDVADTEEN